MSSPKSPAINREQILWILKGMNVELSPDTKLGIDKLEHRLQKALGAAQRLSTVFSKTERDIKPTSYPFWNTQKPLAPVFRRTTWGKLFDVRNFDIMREMPHPKDAFDRILSHIQSLSEDWDREGHDFFALLKDPISKRALVIKVFSVHQVDAKTPLIFIGYDIVEGLEVADYSVYFKEFLGSGDSMVLSFVTRLEQDLFLELLSRNRRRISPDFRPHKMGLDKRCKLSFLVPITGLTQMDIAHLSKNSGCAVCGRNTASTCAACISVQYCGKECQRKDWTSHKHLCRSIASGKWYTVTLDRNPVAQIMHEVFGSNIPSSMPKWNINRFDSTTDEGLDGGDLMDASAPPNKYDEDEHFLVKIQVPIGSARKPRSMFIYDRQRSFEMHLLSEREPEAFEAALGAMGNNLKIYRWARRVGDFQWKICFDRAPERDPLW
ncbi:hypothetical protein P691DRAFT_734285 [Macrolepiota fuliginosa MF-IS2]|uniref:MYND-type domain-containing protein n=1 Tax=Macrolepiota fuliginosa MF-IS2 TaxID=1400762 RepID=A0A9P5X7B5_9AGAR|nr:hypothetical protein P691DRAFT_734285 [Macrolepiota fuliginosa MF-IS2]